MRKSRVVRLWESEVEQAIAEIFEGCEEEMAEIVESVRAAVCSFTSLFVGIFRTPKAEKLIIPVLHVCKAENRRRRLRLEVV